MGKYQCTECLCLFICMFLLGSCILLFGGCNYSENGILKGGCIGYEEVLITIVGYEFYEEKCNQKSTQTICWAGYGIGVYGSKNHTCSIEGYESREQNEAESETKKRFKLHKKYDVLKVKGSDECQIKDEPYALWVLGVLFLSVGGCLLICLPWAIRDEFDRGDSMVSPGSSSD
jgi:hypothetical protein